MAGAEEIERRIGGLQPFEQAPIREETASKACRQQGRLGPISEPAHEAAAMMETADDDALMAWRGRGKLLQPSQIAAVEALQHQRDATAAALTEIGPECLVHAAHATAIAGREQSLGFGQHLPFQRAAPNRA